ncbi:hypothetical protein EDB81DRAFT_874266 [Dactylonectria macrodidyma]|uniref:Uncharacterized protein n=1 Tax=Dactylonectria macrodidyma TaxID=307937 RepID=A0A9P9FQR6_9HYPO|nr:hypothetical protein EDB81DRAFT_874266 [Dactylonectria macrodidyma]
MQTQTTSVPTRLSVLAPSHTYFIGDSTSSHKRVFQDSIGFKPLTAVPTFPFVERSELPELPFRRIDNYEPQLFSDYYLPEHQRSREIRRRGESQMTQALSAQQISQRRPERRRPHLRINTTLDAPLKLKWKPTHHPIRNQPSPGLPSFSTVDLDSPRSIDPFDVRSPYPGRRCPEAQSYPDKYTLDDFYDDILFALRGALVVTTLCLTTLGCILAFWALLEFGFRV